METHFWKGQSFFHICLELFKCQNYQDTRKTKKADTKELFFNNLGANKYYFVSSNADKFVY